jgi:hypothetical protein
VGLGTGEPTLTSAEITAAIYNGVLGAHMMWSGPSWSEQRLSRGAPHYALAFQQLLAEWRPAPSVTPGLVWVCTITSHQICDLRGCADRVGGMRRNAAISPDLPPLSAHDMVAIQQTASGKLEPCIPVPVLRLFLPRN